MCVDYTNMNKAFPMDPFPLMNLDQMVDETSGCELLSFMYAFKFYYQILMALEDKEKTAFQTPEGFLYYTGMAFELRNSGATYQQMVNCLFKDLLGVTREAYVDDMLVKNKYKNWLEKVLLDHGKIQYTPKSKEMYICYEIGKFIGFMTIDWGIEPNLVKRQSPRCNPLTL